MGLIHAICTHMLVVVIEYLRGLLAAMVCIASNVGARGLVDNWLSYMRQALGREEVKFVGHSVGYTVPVPET